jgi:hypothetical protein
MTGASQEDKAKLNSQYSVTRLPIPTGNETLGHREGPSPSRASLAPWEQLARHLVSGDSILDIEPPKYLIGDLLTRDALAFLIGKPAAGKSFLALDWGLCVAFGFPWQGREVRKGRVLYLAAEGRRGIGKRIKAWLQHTGETKLPDTFVLLPTAVNLLREAEREALVEMARRLDFDLVIIDTLARSMVGGEENSSRDLGIVIDAADRMRDGQERTCLIVHHTDKAGSTYRGSSAIEGAADWMHSVENEDDTPEVVLRCKKAKDDEEPKPILLRREVVRLDQDGGVTSCVLVSHGGVGIEKAANEAKAKLSHAAWDHFGNGVFSRKMLRDVIDMPSTTFYRVEKELVKAGIWENIGTDKQPAYKVADPTLFDPPDGIPTVPTPLPPANGTPETIPTHGGPLGPLVDGNLGSGNERQQDQEDRDVDGHLLDGQDLEPRP